MFATYALIMSISFIVLAASLSFWFEDYYLRQRTIQLEGQRPIINQLAFKYMGNAMALDNVEDTLKFISNYLQADIWLVDNWGYVYSVSNYMHKDIVGKQMFMDQIEYLKKNQVIEKKKVYKNLYDGMVHSIEFPIIDESGQFIGSAVINTPMSQITEPLNKFYMIIWISAALAMAFSCYVIYIFSQRIILRPLSQINDVARKISKGEVEKRVHIETNDEIGELASSFNYMADFLEKIEDNRRQFMSNVSHEIRSPITSIKGFIGGIIDGVVPKEKENYYLKLAHEEIQRLTRLVNELLDLSALQDGKFKLIVEEVDINEILRITVLKFENNIKEKNLKVDVCFDNDKCMIMGDRDRLIQVVTNLMDNAVKYGNDNSKISIKSKEKSKQAIISIHNQCDPIPQQSLNKLWQRFYRVDKSRTSKASTGLGLSIVREILSQLGQEVWAENKEDGVCFTFTLDKCKVRSNAKENKDS